MRKYTLPPEQGSLTQWSIGTSTELVFNWDYDAGREKLLALYEKGKRLQWDANTRIDWSQPVDPDNPLDIPDEYMYLYGSPIWDKMGKRERAEVRQHTASWQLCQFLHGEQGALVCTARIVESVPQIDAKYYAATQVVDEARHMEVYARFIREKLEVAYPINPQLKLLLNQVLSDSRWDMTYLGMQILVEGLALAAFNVLRDLVGNPLVRAITAYVMQDEARHVAFGRLVLRDLYPQLSAAERAEREEFVVEASYLMRDRLQGEEVWERLGLDRAQCAEYLDRSMVMKEYRRMLFSRIVPTIKDIGLFGPRVRKAYEEMGVLSFAELDPDQLGAADEERARQIDNARDAAHQRPA